jgi:hypothetical protein
MDVSLLRVYNNGYTMRRSCIMFCRQSCDEKRVIVDCRFFASLIFTPHSYFLPLPSLPEAPPFPLLVYHSFVYLTFATVSSLIRQQSLSGRAMWRTIQPQPAREKLTQQTIMDLVRINGRYRLRRKLGSGSSG